jgi:hypothetical protein
MPCILLMNRFVTIQKSVVRIKKDLKSKHIVYPHKLISILNSGS